MTRSEMYRRLAAHPGVWDMIVVGGGATGAGVAIDAASRGYGVLLLEQSDFGKGTSSRSTKLVHGGVRYLEQGNLSLVVEALKGRGLLLQNAPHLVRNLGFVVPNYDWGEARSMASGGFPRNLPPQFEQPLFRKPILRHQPNSGRGRLWTALRT